MVANGRRFDYNERTFILDRGRDERGSNGPRRTPADRGPGSGVDRRGPRPLTDLLGELFAARGLARIQAHGEIEAAWALAVGESGRPATRVEGLRRGVLSVIVAHPTLLEELASFQKPELLASLRRSLGGASIHDIRFRVGPIDGPEPAVDDGRRPS
jgi:predicted nucleic acid-binding Zn ribbon protein